jgi:hypothetical protein
VDLLLCDNTDYVVNAVMQNMAFLESNPRAPVVLCVLLEHTSSQVLPLVQDTVRAVLAKLSLASTAQPLPLLVM